MGSTRKKWGSLAGSVGEVLDPRKSLSCVLPWPLIEPYRRERRRGQTQTETEEPTHLTLQGSIAEVRAFESSRVQPRDWTPPSELRHRPGSRRFSPEPLAVQPPVYPGYRGARQNLPERPEATSLAAFSGNSSFPVTGNLPSGENSAESEAVPTRLHAAVQLPEP